MLKKINIRCVAVGNRSSHVEVFQLIRAEFAGQSIDNYPTENPQNGHPDNEVPVSVV